MAAESSVESGVALAVRRPEVIGNAFSLGAANARIETAVFVLAEGALERVATNAQSVETNSIVATGNVATRVDSVALLPKKALVAGAFPAHANAIIRATLSKAQILVLALISKPAG